MLHNLAFVMMGGSLGAASRYAVSVAGNRLPSSFFPAATFTVNVLGSFLLGLLLSLQTGNLGYHFLAVGFMGSFTTFSTFQIENINLFKNSKHYTLILYVGGTLIFCISAALLGLFIGTSKII